MSDLHFSNLAAKKNPAETGRLIHPLALLAPGAASAGAGLAHKAWVPVASAEHVRLGREQGFMQVCHGKAAPLRRVHPGDRVVYYSPSVSFRGKDKLQCFTALGVVQAGEPFAFDMGGGFCPFRRELAWSQACETPILPLLDQLEFTAGVRNWGYQLRFGLLAIGQRDIELIASAMQSAATN